MSSKYNMGGFMSKSRSGGGKLGGAKGKGKKGSGMGITGGSSFKTYKQSGPSTSTKLPKGATSRKR